MSPPERREPEMVVASVTSLETKAAELSEAFGRQFVVTSRVTNSGNKGHHRQAWLSLINPGRPLVHLTGPMPAYALMAAMTLLQTFHEHEIIQSTI